MPFSQVAPGFRLVAKSLREECALMITCVLVSFWRTSHHLLSLKVCSSGPAPKPLFQVSNMVGRLPLWAKSLRLLRAFMMMTGTSVKASRPMIVGSKSSCTEPSSPRPAPCSTAVSSWVCFSFRRATAARNSPISGGPIPASASSSSPTRSGSSRSLTLSTPIATRIAPNGSSPAWAKNLITPSSPSASSPSASISCSTLAAASASASKRSCSSSTSYSWAPCSGSAPAELSPAPFSRRFLEDFLASFRFSCAISCSSSAFRCSILTRLFRSSETRSARSRPPKATKSAWFETYGSSLWYTWCCRNLTRKEAKELKSSALWAAGRSSSIMLSANSGSMAVSSKSLKAAASSARSMVPDESTSTVSKIACTVLRASSPSSAPSSDVSPMPWESDAT
mmetsp:Transcript_41026/g.92357  ORF Transcript_41026/g.92357 Transcript_41026/m.92357 type:complete len:395 (+) Transcript_41026:1615-2799(+)